MKGPAPKPVNERFWSNVSPEPNTGCWLWTGNVTMAGFGQIRVGSMRDGSRRYELTHRFSYQEVRGDIQDGMVVDHLCRQPACVNPSHMEIVTRGENVRRGVVGTPATNPGAIHNLAKTHCRNGHPYSGDNLVISTVRGRQERGCRICRNAAAASHYQRNKR